MVITIFAIFVLSFFVAVNAEPKINFNNYLDYPAGKKLSMDMYGDLIAVSIRGIGAGVDPVSYESHVEIWDMQDLSAPVAIIDDPDSLYNPAQYFGQHLSMDDTYLAISSGSQKKVYIYDLSTPASPTLFYTWSLSGATDTIFPGSADTNGKTRMLEMDKGNSRIVIACGLTQCTSRKYDGVSSWTGGTFRSKNTIDGTKSFNTLALSYGGRFWIACQSCSGSTCGCQLGTISATGTMGSSYGFLRTTSSTSQVIGTIAIRNNIANPEQAPYFVMLGHSTVVSTYQWQASGIGGFVPGWSEECDIIGVNYGGGKYVDYDAETGYLLIGHNVPQNTNRCVVQVTSTLYNSAPTPITYLDIPTNANGEFAARQLAIHGNSIAVANAESTSGTTLRGVWIAYDQIIPPPTASPTVSPTPSPTFECVGPAQCAGTDYCTTGNTCTTAQACTAHVDCHEEFTYSLPYCDIANSICKDIGLVGSCSSEVECTEKAKLELAKQKGIASTALIITAASLSDKRNATLESVARSKATLSPGFSAVYVVENTQSATIDANVLEEVGSAAYKTALKQQICGVYADLCTVTIVEAGSRRQLQQSTSATVEITYELDDEAYDAISENGLDSGNFTAELAELLGVNETQITVSGVDGSIVVGITLVETDESDTEPLGEEILAEISLINANIVNITSDLVTELGLDPSDIEAQAIDLCADRTCNNRGACDDSDGVCDCDEGFWGINCGTTCNCENEGVCQGSLCICTYPNYGLRCDDQVDCSC